MIQVNLVPDVKQKFLKAQRMKRIILVGSVFLSICFIGLVVLMFMYVNIVQSRHKSNLQGDIDENIATIQNKKDIDKVLTVQKQLETLPGLHQNKPRLSRLSLFLAQTVPRDVTIGSLQIDFSTNTMVIQGNGNNIKSVNIYVDTLKNASYKTKSTELTNAFSNIVLESISTVDDGTGASYNITAQFDPIIFINPGKVELSVPNITSTRSEVDRPKIFNNQDNSRN